MRKQGCEEVKVSQLAKGRARARFWSWCSWPPPLPFPRDEVSLVRAGAIAAPIPTLPSLFLPICTRSHLGEYQGAVWACTDTLWWGARVTRHRAACPCHSTSLVPFSALRAVLTTLHTGRKNTSLQKQSSCRQVALRL